MIATLDAQRTQPDRRTVRRPGCPGWGVPPDPPPEATHHQRRTPCSASPPAATGHRRAARRAARRDRWPGGDPRTATAGWSGAGARPAGCRTPTPWTPCRCTWLRLAENCDRIQHADRLGGWLTTTAYRECLRILRPTRARRSPSTASPDTVPDPAAGPRADRPRHRDRRRLCADWSPSCPPRSRTIIQAMFTDETHPYTEISRRTGIPIGSLGPTRARALHQLRRMLTERGLEHPA